MGPRLDIEMEGVQKRVGSVRIKEECLLGFEVVEESGEVSCGEDMETLVNRLLFRERGRGSGRKRKVYQTDFYKGSGMKVLGSWGGREEKRRGTFGCID